MQEGTSLFILAGQSNMAGRGNTDELGADRAAPRPDIPFFYETDFGRDRATTPPSASAGWTDLSPQPKRPSTPAGHFGPELSFGWRIAQLAPDLSPGIIKIAYGGTDLAGDWNPEAHLGLRCYERMLRAVKAASEECKTCRVRGFLWMQGEADAMDIAKAEAYQGNLAGLVTRVRRDLRRPDLPVIIGRIHPAQALVHPQMIREAQEQVVEKDPHAALVDTDDLRLSDAVHFDTQSQIELGTRFADSALRLLADTPL